jgi:hypothetical protein
MGLGTVVGKENILAGKQPLSSTHPTSYRTAVPRKSLSHYLSSKLDLGVHF